jgi:hypothetical protein
MKNARKMILLITAISVLFISACSKYDEPVPFYDGLFLEYFAGLKIIYNVHSIKNGNYKIIKTEVGEVLGDDIDDIFVDIYGKVYKSTFKDYEGKFSFIWIPVHQLNIGDTFNNGYKVLRKDKWKKWKVLVVKNPYFNEERYFELNTGYLVGAKGNIEMNLVKTNADIPTVE